MIVMIIMIVIIIMDVHMYMISIATTADDATPTSIFRANSITEISKYFRLESVFFTSA
jgi:hypothetical protein